MIDQATALINMYIIILFLGVPVVANNIVPPIGMSKMGVKKATPATPHFFQIVTNLLELLVNLFFGLANFL